MLTAPPPALAINLTGQTGSIPTTAIVLVDSCGAGMYAVYADVQVTSPGTAGTVQATITWSDGINAAGASLLNSPLISLTSVAETGAFLGVINAVAGQPISYNTTVTGAVGQPVYAIRIRLLFLG